MIDTIKKTLLAGLGATVVTAERIEKSMNELIEKGKLNAEEAREVADKVVAQGKAEWESSRQEMADTLNKFLKDANLATRDELDALSKRIDALTKRVGSLEKEAAESENE